MMCSKIKHAYLEVSYTLVLKKLGSPSYGYLETKTPAGNSTKRAEGSVTLLQTKTRPVPSVAHCQGRGISFELFSRPWQKGILLLSFTHSESIPKTLDDGMSTM